MKVLSSVFSVRSGRLVCSRAAAPIPEMPAPTIRVSILVIHDAGEPYGLLLFHCLSWSTRYGQSVGTGVLVAVATWNGGVLLPMMR